jgi:hypothetical protein
MAIDFFAFDGLSTAGCHRYLRWCGVHFTLPGLSQTDHVESPFEDWSRPTL